MLVLMLILRVVCAVLLACVMPATMRLMKLFGAVRPFEIMAFTGNTEQGDGR